MAKNRIMKVPGDTVAKKCRNAIPRRSDTCPHCLGECALLLRLSSYLKPNWHMAVIVFVVSVIAVGLGNLVQPIITREPMDKVFGPGATGNKGIVSAKHLRPCPCGYTHC